MLLVLLACAKPVPVKTMEVTPAALTVPTDAESVAHGEFLALKSLGCTECHGDDLAGLAYIDAFPMGTLVGPNLTTLEYSQQDWVGAIRHGVAPGGRMLLEMPSDQYYLLTDTDLGALVAYLDQLEPVAHDLPEQKLGPVGRSLVEKGSWTYAAESLDHSAAIPSAAPENRGRYLAVTSGCVDCHAGGVGQGFGPGVAPSTNLTPHEDGLKGWSQADFLKAMREGVRPDGTQLDTTMPWPLYADWPEDDLVALWEWTQSLEPQPNPE